MVFGDNLLVNAYSLADRVDHIEIVLFHTPTLHNFPSTGEVGALRRLGAEENVSYSVHLPASLEIAARDRKKRKTSVQMVVDLIDLLSELNPQYHVLHIPFTTPTLTPVPGRYFTIEHQDSFIDWSHRAKGSLEAIQERIHRKDLILVENIDYSPIFLERFWKSGLCGFCLDMGHLMLGRESVSEATTHFMSVIREIHLHGVRGHEEHLSLAVLPRPRIAKWIELLIDDAYSGIINLEVFSAECLEASMNILIELFQGRHGHREDLHGPTAFSTSP